MYTLVNRKNYNIDSFEHDEINQPEQRIGKSANNQSFSAKPTDASKQVGALLMRIDAKISAEPNNPKQFLIRV